MRAENLRRRLQRLQRHAGSNPVTWEVAYEAGQRAAARVRLKMVEYAREHVDEALATGDPETADTYFAIISDFGGEDVDEALLEETERSDEATLEAYRRQRGFESVHNPLEQLAAKLDGIADRMQCVERMSE